MKATLAAGSVAALLLTTGCDGVNRQQLGTVIGGAAGGALLGGSIGRLLDERDRARAEAATVAALRQPLPPGFYRASFTTPTQGAPFAPAPSRGSFPSPAPRAFEPAPATPASSAPAGRLPGLPRAPAQRWVSDHSGASGSATVIRATPPQGGRGECRTVQSIAQRSGQQETNTQDFCEATPGAGDWQAI